LVDPVKAANRLATSMGPLNVTLTAINVFYIVRLLRGRHDSRTFEVVEISPNEAYLEHLLHEFDADIQHFNPGFSGDDAARTDLGFLILTGAETVGLVLAGNAGGGSVVGRPRLRRAEVSGLYFG
jgi:hypothetical protein